MTVLARSSDLRAMERFAYIAHPTAKAIIGETLWSDPKDNKLDVMRGESSLT